MKRISKLLSGVLILAGLSCAQDPEDFRLEVTAGAWSHNARGDLQPGALRIDLRNDLNLNDTYTLQGRFTFKPARRHRIFVEGAPYSLEGENTLDRTIVFQGRTYNVRDRVQSSADLTYVAAGYQFDVISNSRGHLGAQLSGAYFDATGTISSLATGISATRSEKVGFPLAGIEFRAFLIPGSRLLNVNGQIKGMGLGDYGHYLQSDAQLGVTLGPFTAQAGYGVLRADVHETGGDAGIAPRFAGPIFSIQFRK